MGSFFYPGQKHWLCQPRPASASSCHSAFIPAAAYRVARTIGYTELSAAQQRLPLLLSSRSDLYYATVSLTNIRFGSVRVLQCHLCNCSSRWREKIVVAQPEITFLRCSPASATRFILFLQIGGSLNTQLLGFKVKLTPRKSTCTTEPRFTPRARDHLAQLDSSLGNKTKRGGKDRVLQWPNQYLQYQ